jgi:hypothetical protein
MRTGIFEMPMAQYLTEHGVSQSALKHLARSPAHLREYLDHPKPSTPDQIIGTLEHLLVFQDGLFESSHWVKPATYTNKKGEIKKWNGNATECKDWLYAHEDRPVISQDSYESIIAMQNEVFLHPAAALALTQGKPEQSLFCEDAETGLQLKCRCDWMSGNSIVDLKKCQDASPNGFAKTVANYGYDLQAAVNLEICRVLELGKENFIFIAVEDKPPFAVGVYQLDAASVAVGYSKFRRLLTKYLECVSTDRWPAYSSNIEYLSLPKWASTVEFNAQLLEDQPAVPALEV